MCFAQRVFLVFDCTTENKTNGCGDMFEVSRLDVTVGRLCSALVGGRDHADSETSVLRRSLAAEFKDSEPAV